MCPSTQYYDHDSPIQWDHNTRANQHKMCGRLHHDERHDQNVNLLQQHFHVWCYCWLILTLLYPAPHSPPLTWVTMETSATLQILILLQWGQFIIGTQSEHLRETGDRLHGATWDPTSTPGWTTELSQSLPRGANNAYDSYFVCMFSCLPATIYLSEIQNIMERIMFCSWCESREVHLENIW